jgi:hypothetical protein
MSKNLGAPPAAAALLPVSAAGLGLPRPYAAYAAGPGSIVLQHDLQSGLARKPLSRNHVTCTISLVESRAKHSPPRSAMAERGGERPAFLHLFEKRNSLISHALSSYFFGYKITDKNVDTFSKPKERASS